MYLTHRQSTLLLIGDFKEEKKKETNIYQELPKYKLIFFSIIKGERLWPIELSFSCIFYDSVNIFCTSINHDYTKGITVTVAFIVYSL